jgi:hypothetical protein
MEQSLTELSIKGVLEQQVSRLHEREGQSSLAAGRIAGGYR